MKKLILMVEDDFIDILQDFKKEVKWWNISDEKAMILITRYFMKQYNKRNDKQTNLFNF